MARKNAVAEAAEEKITDVIGVVSAKNGLNIRQKADINSKIIAVLKDGDKVVITGEDGDFYQTATGYVMKKFITIDD